MPRLSPTTKVQISGHKFLKRRLAHGLAFGDIRMIHDPLARRRRSLIFGLAASALVAIGAGAMALFAPAAHPGDAPILKADSGQLYAKIDQRYHPVPNLTSARIIVGQAAQPADVSDPQLGELPKGYPVGIVDAPGIYSQERHEGQWLACHTSQPATSRTQQAVEEVTVVAAGVGPAQLSLPQPLYARADGQEYVITNAGRYLLPPADTTEGRQWRRALAIAPDTPVWQPPTQVLSLVPEQPFIIPPATNQLWHSAGGSYLHTGDGVVAMSPAQALTLAAAGYTSTEVLPAQLATVAESATPVSLPDAHGGFMDIGGTWKQPEGEHQTLCVGSDGALGVMDKDSLPAGQELAGEAVATHYVGPGAAVAVDTGSGTHVVSETGRRHRLDDTSLDIIGAGQPTAVDWNLLRLLPEGSVLGPATAALALD